MISRPPISSATSTAASISTGSVTSQFTSQALLDEKIAGTIHLALGRALPQTVPEGQPYNNSSVHKDMLVDVSEDSFVEVDGEVIQQDGTFAFEE